MVAGFEGRIGRDATKVVWGLTGGEGHRTRGKVVVGSSEEYGGGI